MKTPYKNIYEVLKMNRFIMLAVIVMAFLSTIISSMISYKMYNKALNGSFAIGKNGEVIPLQWVQEKENLEVEALEHLRLFHNYFYGLDAINFESHIE